MKSDKREKAIKYLTEEIRSLRMAPQINGCGPENWAEQLEIMDTCLQAVRSAHFAEAGKMQLLTLEQLRDMDGQPYWHVGLQEDSPKPHWKILDPFVSKHPEDYGYGKRWLAYAYPPANIEREAWISVKERLPNKGQNVLVFCNSRYAKGWKFAIDSLEEGEKNPIWIYTHGWFEVTHWMPLPEPPESRPPEGQS